MADNYIDLIRHKQREITDYFYYWRKGRARDWNTESRADAISRVRIPKPGKWPGFDGRGTTQRKDLHPVRQWKDIGPEETKPVAVQRASDLDRRVEAAGFKVIKLLGWGGLGLACLIEYLEHGQVKRVVAKADIYTEKPLIKDEIKMHLKVAGAKHVIQRVVMRHHDPKGKGKAVQDDVEMTDDDTRLREELDSDTTLLFIEYMPLGRFYDYIAKASRLQAWFPNKVLWTIFRSLYRGVVGLAYPGKFQPEHLNPRIHNLPQISESSQGQPELSPWCKRETIVHFDIDGLNLLVGDFDGDEHKIAPLVKIADLGIARVFDGVSQSAWDYWKLRKTGKTNILTPEQTTEEWDWVNLHPADAGVTIAGNYNWYTNLYQIGLVMFSLITLHKHEYPPVIRNVVLRHPDGTETDEWTYGGSVSGPWSIGIDPDLTHLVALCLVADPTRRPTMAELEYAFSRKLGSQDSQMTEEDIKAQEWATKIFKKPAAPESKGEGSKTQGASRGKALYGGFHFRPGRTQQNPEDRRKLEQRAQQRNQAAGGPAHKVVKQYPVPQPRRRGTGKETNFIQERRQKEKEDRRRFGEFDDKTLDKLIEEEMRKDDEKQREEFEDDSFDKIIEEGLV
ncbi:hypothetical protein VTJ49DRAFT_7739 [Mycothermus thermophilus]|uniref:Protein kinase domain-containing protein n=1 Tax=Humicola insolens TaxID=85995 RepID=A0ABR3VG71_HUMIN